MPDYDDKFRAYQRRQRKMKDKRKRESSRNEVSAKEGVSLTSYHRVRLDPRYIDRYQEDDDVFRD